MKGLKTGTHWISTEHWTPGYPVSWPPKNTSGKKYRKPVYYELAWFIFILKSSIFNLGIQMVNKLLKFHWIMCICVSWYPWSTLSQHLDWHGIIVSMTLIGHLISILIDMWLTVNQQSIHGGLIVGWVLTDLYIDWKLVESWRIVEQDVNRVSMEC